MRKYKVGDITGPMTGNPGHETIYPYMSVYCKGGTWAQRSTRDFGGSMEKLKAWAKEKSDIEKAKLTNKKPAPVRCGSCLGQFPRVLKCKMCDKNGWRLTKEQRDATTKTPYR